MNSFHSMDSHIVMSTTNTFHSYPNRFYTSFIPYHTKCQIDSHPHYHLSFQWPKHHIHHSYSHSNSFLSSIPITHISSSSQSSQLSLFPYPSFHPLSFHSISLHFISSLPCSSMVWRETREYSWLLTPPALLDQRLYYSIEFVSLNKQRRTLTEQLYHNTVVLDHRYTTNSIVIHTTASQSTMFDERNV